MSRDFSKFKKFAKYILEALGVAALILLAIYLISGKSTPLESSNVFKGNYGGLSGVLPSGAPRPTIAPSPESAPAADSSATQNDSSQASQPTERQVVKEGSLALLVKKAEETTEKIKSVANDLGGFTDEVNLSSVSETSKSGTVIIRVPANKFDEAMNKIKELAIKVDREAVTAINVTAEFIDLEAHLKNLKAEEQQYLKIMTQASKVEDILSVSQNLNDVRDIIERLQANINYLSSQIEMSSITVSLTEEADVQLFGLRWRPLFVIKQSFRNMLEGLTNYVDSLIGFILFLPALILWLATFIAGLWVAKKIYRFVKRKLFSSKS